MRVNRKPPVIDTKTESIAEDGKLDMDLVKTDKEDTKRLVNINTIKWIVIGGVKYVVE